jgi:hypothetical protein
MKNMDLEKDLKIKTMYQLEIKYQTGDSLNSYQETEVLCLSWKDINNAKENLLYIKEHYKMYEEFVTAYTKDKYKILEKYENKEWFVKPEKNDYNLERSITIINFKLDNGNKMRARADWCGIFENLEYAKVVLEPDEDLEFNKY